MTKPLSLVALILLLVACATAPQNVSEAIGQSYATLATVAHDVSAAKASGLLSDVDAAKLKGQLQAAKNNVDFALSAYAAGRDAEVENRLEATRVVIRSIIKVLKDREAANG